MKKRIVIMAGGTGGHVYPALAVAQYLVEQEWRVSWIGSKQGLESKLLPTPSIEVDWLPVKGLRGKGWLAKINNSLLLLKALWQALIILRQRQPDVVLGMGGYVAGPGGIMSILLRIPLIIHEQNRVPGTTNRLLKKRANKVLEAFPGSFAQASGAVFVGNPLRSSLLAISRQACWNAEAKRDLRLLVVGGSQGAKVLNTVVPPALASLSKIKVVHQTGSASLAQVKQRYADHAMAARVVDFIEDIAPIYQWADLIICRSGAMAVSEAAAVGLPAIFIPLPHAIDDHQTANANYLSECGAAILLPQHALNEKSLVQAIEQVKQSLATMSVAAKKLAKPEATRLVATICEQVAG